MIKYNFWYIDTIIVYMHIFLPKPVVSKSKYRKVLCTIGTRCAFDCGGKICDGISSAGHFSIVGQLKAHNWLLLLFPKLKSVKLCINWTIYGYAIKTILCYQ